MSNAHGILCCLGVFFIKVWGDRKAAVESTSQQPLFQISTEALNGVGTDILAADANVRRTQVPTRTEEGWILVSQDCWKACAPYSLVE
ncbi:MAG: hypothetical protein V1792_28890 [Pseudomonadota bacterium]